MYSPTTLLIFLLLTLVNVGTAFNTARAYQRYKDNEFLVNSLQEDVVDVNVEVEVDSKNKTETQPAAVKTNKEVLAKILDNPQSKEHVKAVKILKALVKTLKSNNSGLSNATKTLNDRTIEQPVISNNQTQSDPLLNDDKTITSFTSTEKKIPEKHRSKKIKRKKVNKKLTNKSFNKNHGSKKDVDKYKQSGAQNKNTTENKVDDKLINKTLKAHHIIKAVFTDALKQAILETTEKALKGTISNLKNNQDELLTSNNNTAHAQKQTQTENTKKVNEILNLENVHEVGGQDVKKISNVEVDDQFKNPIDSHEVSNIDEVKNGENGNQISNGENIKELSDGTDGNEFKAMDSGKESKVDLGKEVTTGENAKEASHVVDSHETPNVESGNEVKNVDAGGEVKNVEKSDEDKNVGKGEMTKNEIDSKKVPSVKEGGIESSNIENKFTAENNASHHYLKENETKSYDAVGNKNSPTLAFNKDQQIPFSETTNINIPTTNKTKVVTNIYKIIIHKNTSKDLHQDGGQDDYGNENKQTGVQAFAKYNKDNNDEGSGSGENEDGDYKDEEVEYKNTNVNRNKPSTMTGKTLTITFQENALNLGGSSKKEKEQVLPGSSHLKTNKDNDASKQENVKTQNEGTLKADSNNINADALLHDFGTSKPQKLFNDTLFEEAGIKANDKKKEKKYNDGIIEQNEKKSIKSNVKYLTNVDVDTNLGKAIEGDDITGSASSGSGSTIGDEMFFSQNERLSDLPETESLNVVGDFKNENEKRNQITSSFKTFADSLSVHRPRVKFSKNTKATDRSRIFKKHAVRNHKRKTHKVKPIQISAIKRNKLKLHTPNRKDVSLEDILWNGETNRYSSLVFKRNIISEDDELTMDSDESTNRFHKELIDNKKQIEIKDKIFQKVLPSAFYKRGEIPIRENFITERNLETKLRKKQNMLNIEKKSHQQKLNSVLSDSGDSEGSGDIKRGVKVGEVSKVGQKRINIPAASISNEGEDVDSLYNFGTEANIHTNPIFTNELDSFIKSFKENHRQPDTKQSLASLSEIDSPSMPVISSSLPADTATSFSEENDNDIKGDVGHFKSDVDVSNQEKSELVTANEISEASSHINADASSDVTTSSNEEDLAGSVETTENVADKIAMSREAFQPDSQLKESINAKTGAPLPLNNEVSPLPSNDDVSLLPTKGSLAPTKDTPLLSGVRPKSNNAAPLTPDIGGPLTSDNGGPLTSNNGVPLIANNGSPLLPSNDASTLTETEPLSSKEGVPLNEKDINEQEKQQLKESIMAEQQLKQMEVSRATMELKQRHRQNSALEDQNPLQQASTRSSSDLNKKVTTTKPKEFGENNITKINMQTKIAVEIVPVKIKLKPRKSLSAKSNTKTKARTYVKPSSNATEKSSPKKRKHPQVSLKASHKKKKKAYPSVWHLKVTKEDSGTAGEDFLFSKRNKMKLKPKFTKRHSPETQENRINNDLEVEKPVASEADIPGVFAEKADRKINREFTSDNIDTETIVDDVRKRTPKNRGDVSIDEGMDTSKRHNVKPVLKFKDNNNAKLEKREKYYAPDSDIAALREQEIQESFLPDGRLRGINKEGVIGAVKIVDNETFDTEPIHSDHIINFDEESKKDDAEFDNEYE